MSERELVAVGRVGQAHGVRGLLYLRTLSSGDTGSQHRPQKDQEPEYASHHSSQGIERLDGFDVAVLDKIRRAGF